MAASPYLNVLTTTDLAFQVYNTGARSQFNFTLQLISPRERFYTTSTVLLNFGFLA